MSTFRATTASLKKDLHRCVPFQHDWDMGFRDYWAAGVLTIPRKGTYALSVKLVPGGAHAGDTPVADCEIVVNGVETPLVLNERKTCARVVLPLDKDIRVGVMYSGEATMPDLIEGVFSLCKLSE